jgi:putative tryptophan/tyrosine transport system substrate-binding protein
MRRRTFVLVLSGAMTAARGLRAQQKAMPVIGFLSSGSTDKFAPYFAAFRTGLAAMGYVEGQSIAIEYRNADGHYDRLAGLAADLVQRNVSAIAVFGLPAALAAKAATKAIPIIFATGVNPVTSGLVASFNRPGGNLTGISMLSPVTGTKQIELLHEIVPKAGVMGVIVNPSNPGHESALAGLQAGARILKIHISVVRVTNEQEIETAFASVSQQGAGAVIFPVDPLFQDRRDQLVELQNRYSLPTVFGEPEFPRLGGLMGYGTNMASAFHDLANYTGRILKGARPEDLPVEQTTKIEMVINFTTAKALGLTIPQSVLGRADEVIE